MHEHSVLIKKTATSPLVIHLTIFQRTRFVGWMVCVALSLAIIFGLISVNNYATPVENLDLGGFGNFFYGGFVYPLWGLCVGWVVLLCTLGMASRLISINTHTYTHYVNEKDID